ncbi:hypothetical protein ACHAWT_001862 [Skeletonema menzelii]
MAKRKKSTATAANSDSCSTTNNAVVSNHRLFFAAIIVVVSAALFITLCCCCCCCSINNFKSFVQSAPSSFQPSNETITTSSTTKEKSKGELFLNWFVDNGGIFHPISSTAVGNDDDNVQITIQKFDGMGWGLAAIVNATSSSFAANDNNNSDDNVCKNTFNANNSCSANSASSIIIPHLAPLFTVPPNLIISISSILNTYASPSSEYYLPNFYTIVNQVLLTSFPRGMGLAKMSSRHGGTNDGGGNHYHHGRMGLVEQDVVIAMMLMTEECLHHLNNNNKWDDSTNTTAGSGSFWGPYLNMLPSKPIPRLDTFDTGAYAMLNDATLEMVGRSSKQRLLSMFHGNVNGNDNNVSIKAVLRDMIHIQQQQQRQRSNSNNNNNNNNNPTVPPECLQFDTFHKFIGIVSSRAMVLKGIKYLTPLAEMMNYKPVSIEEQIAVVHSTSSSSGSSNEFSDQVGMMRKGGGMIHTPFDLYHTIGEDDSITVRSDRNVMLPFPQQQIISPHDDNAVGDDTATATATTTTTTIQIFEDYGPVDSSLFLEMHAFVPSNNPHHCAVIHGKHFLRRQIANGRSDPNSTMLLRALKALHLTSNPQLTQFVSLEDVCVRNDMSIVEDGSVMIGRRPASDGIAIMSLLLGESTEKFPNLEVLKSKCIAAIESNDVERIELRCARYPGSRRVVKQALVNAANRSVSEADVSLETLSSWLEEAERDKGGGGKEQLALAVRFRLEERKILDSIASIVLNNDESKTHIVVDRADDDHLDAKLSSFNQFIDSLNLPVNKIRAQAVEGMRLGAVATEDLESEEVYISLPPNAVIDAASAVADAETSSPRLAALLKKLDSQPSDGFDVLLVYLLHERYVLKNDSKWWPYLDLLPTVQEVSSSHPLFFDEEEMNLYLGGSDVRKFILRNQVRAFERHTALASDVDVHEVLGSNVVLDKSIVYWATAILDSRSIWWEGRRHLTPLLDLVNADIVGRAHETKVEESSAVTRASRPVKRGEQVYENYQQPNYLLFAFHGFMLDHNPSDCALLGGLSINRNDPGAKFANRLQSSPTFCISGTNIDTMEELAQFLRMKHGILANELNSVSSLNEKIVPYLAQVLKERISRLEDLTELGTDLEDESVPQRRRYMSRVASSDLAHFQGSLELLKESKS